MPRKRKDKIWEYAIAGAVTGCLLGLMMAKKLQSMGLETDTGAITTDAAIKGGIFGAIAHKVIN
jgi:hypothetical protein